jgi:hypothetical protein
MIKHESSYRRWLQQQGVGARDNVASSPASYVSYLNSTSKLIGKPISTEILSSEADVERIARQIAGMRAPNTLRNYKSAMRQYVAMAKAGAYPQPT